MVTEWDLVLMHDSLMFSRQESCSSGKVSQSGRSNASTVCHSTLHALSLIFLHWPEVGWMETPELSHKPNRCTHRNGIAAALHSEEEFWFRA